MIPQPLLKWMFDQIPSPSVNEAFRSYPWASVGVALRELYSASASEPLTRISRVQEFCGRPTEYVRLGYLSFDVEPVEVLNR